MAAPAQDRQPAEYGHRAGAVWWGLPGPQRRGADCSRMLWRLSGRCNERRLPPRIQVWVSRFAAEFPFIQISRPKGLRVQNNEGGKIQCAHLSRRQRLFLPLHVSDRRGSQRPASFGCSAPSSGGGYCFSCSIAKQRLWLARALRLKRDSRNCLEMGRPSQHGWKFP